MEDKKEYFDYSHIFLSSNRRRGRKPTSRVLQHGKNDKNNKENDNDRHVRFPLSESARIRHVVESRHDDKNTHVFCSLLSIEKIYLLIQH